MGVVHKSKFKPGDRINDQFILLYEFTRESNDPQKPEWLW